MSGKKYFVIPSETYEMMMERKEASIQQPEKHELQKSEQEMKHIWDNTNIPLHEKVKQFTEELNKYKTYFNYLSQPLKVQVEEPNNKVEVNRKEKSLQNTDEDEEEMKLFKTASKPPSSGESDIGNEKIINKLPKDARKKGQIMLDFLKMHPDKIKWNDRGEMVYLGRTIYGSDMSNLLTDVLTKRKKYLSPAFHTSSFLKALADIDVPMELIKNKKQLDMVEMYKQEDYNKQDTRKSPTKSQKRIEWISSTSSRR